MNRPTLCATVALFLLLPSCCGNPATDVKAERSAYDLVTGAAIDRPGGAVQVDWLTYLRNDDRLTPAELAAFEDFAAAWDFRIRAGEQEADR